MQKEDIDFVITWVDGNDPMWQQEKKRFEKASDKQNEDDSFINANRVVRYRDWGNLQYWFRGVEKYAPWVHKIYFVTYGHIPLWLNTKNPKLVIMPHEKFIPKEYLPTFQSPAIENNFHRIPNLSEQFVYFNDDMFIIKPCLPTDFFVNGLPCDCAILNMGTSVNNATTYEETSAKIINSHWSKKVVIHKNPGKWINLKYFPQLMRTFLLMPWNLFGTLYQPHLPSSFLKSSFEEVWKAERKILDKTCREKFRGKGRVSQYLFLDWQRVTGQFYPRSIRVGKCFQLGKDAGVNYNQCYQACDYIKKQKGKLICLNDGDMTENEFFRQKELLQKAFHFILPDKCTYEK